jgi:hypothetical protein
VRAAKPRASEDILLSDRERAGAFWLLAVAELESSHQEGAFWLFAVVEKESIPQ